MWGDVEDGKLCKFEVKIEGEVVASGVDCRW